MDKNTQKLININPIQEIAKRIGELSQDQKMLLLEHLNQTTPEIEHIRMLFLQEQRDKTFQKIDEGTTCPNCDQHAQKYRKSLPSSSAVFLCSLIKQIEETGEPAIHFNDCKFFHRGYADLSYWGLAYTYRSQKDDRVRWSGYWRPTEKGISFAKGMISIPKYIHVYNNEVVLVEDGEQATIYDTLRERADFVVNEIKFDFDLETTLPKPKPGLEQMVIPFGISW